jgi:hypothetical protein
MKRRPIAQVRVLKLLDQPFRDGDEDDSERTDCHCGHEPDEGPGIVFHVHVPSIRGVAKILPGQRPAPSYAQGSTALVTRLQESARAAFAHAERRDGGCDTSAAHEQGDQRVKAEAERLAEAVQQWRMQRYAEGRRD